MFWSRSQLLINSLDCNEVYAHRHNVLPQSESDMRPVWRHVRRSHAPMRKWHSRHDVSEEEIQHKNEEKHLCGSLWGVIPSVYLSFHHLIWLIWIFHLLFLLRYFLLNSRITVVLHLSSLPGTYSRVYLEIKIHICTFLFFHFQYEVQRSLWTL